MAFTGIEDANVIAALAKNGDAAVRLAAVVALRKRQDPSIALFLADSSPAVVKEAIRAIHDVPALHSQLSAVADLIVAPGDDDAVVRRVLNANFRLGGRLNADRLAGFAARAEASPTHRVEALELLASWAVPGKNDRIMNRFLPLENRDSKDAIDALKGKLAEITAGPIAVRDKFLEIGAKYGITEIQKLLEQTIADETVSGARRGAALRALSSVSPGSAKKLLETLVNSNDVELRLAATGVFAQQSPRDAIAVLQKGTQSDIVRERQAAWDLIGSLPDSDQRRALLAEGVQKIIDKKLAPDSILNVLESSKKGSDAQLRASANKIEAELLALKETDPVKAYVDCLEGGDIEKGREIFFTRSSVSCVRCHKVGNTGGEVGPVLSEIGNTKNLEYLLEAIVAPNATVAKGFETVMIVDDEDAVFSGILKSEDDENLVLLDAQGVTLTIAKDSVVGRKAGQSSMPVDIIKNLTRRDLRDLVAYLKSLDGTPAATVGIGAPVEGHKL